MHIYTPFPMHLTFLAVLCQLSVTSPPAFADSREEPSAKQFVDFHLIANKSAVGKSGEVLLGLDVKLKPGWVFYWKDPGRFGIAPKFDWSQSDNLESALVYWPAPMKIVYSDQPPVSTLGYKGSVLLPILARLKQAGGKIEVRLNLQYAVCNDFCISDNVSLSLTLPAGMGRQSLHSKRLKQAMDRAPR